MSILHTTRISQHFSRPHPLITWYATRRGNILNISRVIDLAFRAIRLGLQAFVCGLFFGFILIALCLVDHT